MKAPGVKALEKATVGGVAPAHVLEIDGWLVPLDPGPIGRAHSAVPLCHQMGAGALDSIEQAYADAGLPPRFRIADVEGLESLRAALTARGYQGFKPTVMQVGDAPRLAGFHGQPGELIARPDEAWARVFCGEGFDPVEGAARVAALSLIPDALYGVVRDAAGQTAAVGVLGFSGKLAAISGLRTSAAHRGQGMASRLLTAFGQAALDRGCGVFLQVEADNPARALYARAGFTDAWTYRYWR